ncbi:MAG: type I DNA topoisomerase [Candidatus Pacebacteria bacterium]|nr:type I DNA topoisomerase [Candidatus Paceibacterota bacterium]
MKLVIVESPTKAKTITHFLEKTFEVTPSYGHVRDLPKSKLGIDIENNFTPHYIIPKKAQKNVSHLKKLSQKAEEVILATDEDREGEAIAWHLLHILNLSETDTKKVKRIAFHEITAPAIQQALNNPRQIDLNLVNAQQARRILDRLVGYQLSPFLWKKVFRGLSAGRVQSPALRLIVEREQARNNFQPEEYWTITAIWEKILPQPNKETNNEFSSELWKINDKTLAPTELNTKTSAEFIKNEIQNKEGEIYDIKEQQTKRFPLPPFTTSSLQQTAFNAFHYSAKKTMMIAQTLYEGKKLAQGPVGLITYMRTDSLNISPLALKDAQKFIQENFPKAYWLEQPRIFKNRSRLTQEAHEAIRPTNPFLTPDEIKQYLTKEEYNLYKLIWSRFIASQLKEAIIDRTTVIIKTQGTKDIYLFKSNFSQLVFEGFLKIYPNASAEKLNNSKPLLKLGDRLTAKEIIPNQHFTQPLPRFNDASLVKTLEKYGIGRPSTYAPIISVLLDRGYVRRDTSKALIPTEIGILVSNLLVQHFSKIVDYNFTSEIENRLDEIALGKANWVEVVKEFYEPFAANLKQKEEEILKENISPITPTEEICPKCSQKLVIRWGKYGKFLACSNWPNCSYTKSLNENSNLENVTCPICHIGQVVPKRNKKGKIFYACSRWPDCNFTSSYPPLNELCPQCHQYLIETKTKIKCSNKDCSYERPKLKETED